MTGLPLALDSGRASAGLLGLLVVVLMITATVLLIRNMNSRLRRLPPEFPPTPGRDQDRDQGPRPPASDA